MYLVYNIVVVFMEILDRKEQFLSKKPYIDGRVDNNNKQVNMCTIVSSFSREINQKTSYNLDSSYLNP